MRSSWVVAMLIVTVAACGKKNEPEMPAPVSTPPSATPVSTTDDAAERARREAEEARRRELEAKRNTLSQMIFFGYDRSDISSEAAATLQAKLPILREDATIRIRVEGHADERGSIEYNLALGLRRAQAVKDYLAGFGVEGSRVTVESFGEDRPLDPGTTESAYARNRRAEFVPTAGTLITTMQR
jgi:peptidoglycan-associated lipoprotein